LVEAGDGDQLAFEDVRAFLGLAQQKLRAPADDLDAVAKKLLQHLLEGQGPWPAVHQGQEDDADGLLERRKLVQLVENELRVGSALEVDHQPHRLAATGAALIANGADACDPVVLDQIADGLCQPVAGLLERDLADNDLVAATLLADVGARAEGDLAAAG